MDPVNGHINLAYSQSSLSLTKEHSVSASSNTKYINNSSSGCSGDNTQKTLPKYGTTTFAKTNVGIGHVPYDPNSLSQSTSCSSLCTECTELEFQSTKLTSEQAAYDQLETMMGVEVFDRFTINIARILYGTPAGWGSTLPRQVNQILDWYNTEQNESSVDQFLNGEFKESEAAIRLNQFIEMFVIHDDLEFITTLCKAKDIRQPNIYKEWKSLTGVTMRDTQLLDARRRLGIHRL
ncbi:hypothetical protein [Endozoicomonas sp. SCSIO W0465]|uniref:hypothetical protein n=1 Tax=Endozoicomonas sp. SCSIO W0465 TaxID=2918516 RepID=UPI002075947D|nr:hypothetical protein [Endozoicomonas sp. SCSIO W0465]USE34855.1 hypothetical protein MJO57_22390 [Endozoicomonas sp. SCSIO W0465]